MKIIMEIIEKGLQNSKFDMKNYTPMLELS
jgi:hypothetical protein